VSTAIIKKAHGARAIFLLLAWGWLPIAQPAAQDDAQTRQLRLLCAQLSGDLTEPGGMAAFQRCLTTHDPAGEIRRDNNIGSGAAVKPGASLTGGCSNCPAHDPNKPVALGPGVNKGNIDNQAGPQYFYFLAGPGHVDVHYAFHEMGLFGNPYKQVLNFDILDQDGNQVLSHDSIESIGNLAKFTRPGNLTKPYRLAIRVTSPDAAIRLGGYFEIEAVGAVRFEGKVAGGNVKPEDTSLVHPGVALTGPPTSLTGPPTSLTGPPTSLTGPPTSLTGPPVALTSGAPVALTSGTPVSLYQPVGALTSVQQSAKELRLTLASDILFDFGRATIRPDAKPALDRVAEIIRQNRGAAVEIEGFTDSIGSADANVRLSNARADSVKHWLIEINKLAGAGFVSRGFGATRFAAANTKPDGSDDPAGRQKNRRVEIVVQKR
jgi:outer membrane protein OmpA-like peptidoglycan-associated protein